MSGQDSASHSTYTHFSLSLSSYLLPDRTRSSKQKTPVVKRTLHPTWNYTFVYEDVSLEDLSERALELTVWDHDRLASNEFVGGIRFSLGTGKSRLDRYSHLGLLTSCFLFPAQVAAMAVRWSGWMPLARNCRCGRTCWIDQTFGWRAAWCCAPVSMEYEPHCHRHSQRHNLHCSNLLPSSSTPAHTCRYKYT